MSRAPLLFTTLLVLTAACTPQIINGLKAYKTPTTLDLLLTQPGQQCNANAVVDTGEIPVSRVAAYYTYKSIYPKPDGSEGDSDILFINENSFEDKVKYWQSLGFSDEEIDLNINAFYKHEAVIHPCQAIGFFDNAQGSRIQKYYNLGFDTYEAHYMSKNYNDFVIEGLTDISTFTLVLSGKENPKDIESRDITVLRNYYFAHQKYNIFDVNTTNMLFFMEIYSDEELANILKIHNTNSLEERNNADTVKEIWRIVLFGHEPNESIPDNIIEILKVKYGLLGHLDDIRDREDQIIKVITYGDLIALVTEGAEFSGNVYNWQDNESLTPELRASRQFENSTQLAREYVLMMEEINRAIIGSK